MPSTLPRRTVTVVVLVLATWRLTSLVVYEDGPWRVLDRLRLWVGCRYYSSEQGGGFMRGTNVVASALGCFHCTSLWVAPIVIACWQRFPRLVAALALSGGAIAVERIHGSR